MENNKKLLMSLDCKPIKEYSLYVWIDWRVINVKRLRQVAVRPDGRYNLTDDNGKRKVVRLESII